MFTPLKSTVMAAALATAVVALSATGTAYATEPSGAHAAAAGSQLAAPPPGHKFHAKFRSLQDCQRQAQRDHPGRAGDWDCRQGPDKSNPWEYWGK